MNDPNRTYARALELWIQLHDCFPSWISVEDMEAIFRQFVHRRLHEAGFLGEHQISEWEQHLMMRRLRDRTTRPGA